MQVYKLFFYFYSMHLTEEPNFSLFNIFHSLFVYVDKDILIVCSLWLINLFLNTTC